jgi:hypothetical protein
MARLILLPALILLAGTLVPGCRSRTGPPRSAFFTQNNDLGKIVERNAPGKESGWEWISASGGNGSGESSTGNLFSPAVKSYHADLTRGFRCQPEAIDKFSRALKADLEKTARETGTEVYDVLETVQEKRLLGFQFRFTQEPMNGTVEVKVKPGKQNQYEVSIKIEESNR